MILRLFDTETEGLKETDCVIQFSFMDIDTDRKVILRMVNTYINTPFDKDGKRRKIDEDAVKVHQITNEFLDKYATMTLSEIVSKYNLRDKGVIWVAHNCDFDKKKINTTLKMEGSEPIDFGFTLNKLRNVRETSNFCTMKYFGNLLPNVRRKGFIKLKDAIAYYGGTEENLIPYFEKRLEQLKVKLPDEKGRSHAHDSLFDTFMIYFLLYRSGLLG